MSPRPLQEKSYIFSLKIIGVSTKLQARREYVLSKQLLKSGTGIGSNIEEAQLAQSMPDFISKMSIAAKEANEKRYWLRLLRDSHMLPNDEAEQLISDVEELIRMLVATIKTSKKI
ncbi:MAG: four helix bundle protein [Candidatus Peribacteraceae bacterium]|nr:four helix bundle protein [Candidatus Peribacteraceae bacterium]